jgi:hypothetical protein
MMELRNRQDLTFLEKIVDNLRKLLENILSRVNDFSTTPREAPPPLPSAAAEEENDDSAAGSLTQGVSAAAQPPPEHSARAAAASAELDGYQIERTGSYTLSHLLAALRAQESVAQNNIIGKLIDLPSAILREFIYQVEECQQILGAANNLLPLFPPTPPPTSDPELARRRADWAKLEEELIEVERVEEFKHAGMGQTFDRNATGASGGAGKGRTPRNRKSSRRTRKNTH